MESIACRLGCPMVGRAAVERETARRVYRLYAPTPAEIQLVDNAAK